MLAAANPRNSCVIHDGLNGDNVIACGVRMKLDEREKCRDIERKRNGRSFVVVFLLFLKRYTRDEQPRMNWDKNDLKHSINYGFLGESENEREKSFNQINVFGCSQ